MPAEVSLLQHIEHRFADLHRFLDERERSGVLRFEGLHRILEEREKALAVATKILHEKHEQINKFREETVEDRQVYARLEMVEPRFVAIEKALEGARASSSAIAGRLEAAASRLDRNDSHFGAIESVLDTLKNESSVREGRWAMVAWGMTLVALVFALLQFIR